MVIRKTMKLSEINGSGKVWYAAERAYRQFEGGRDLLAEIGSELNLLTVSMLENNGVSELLVSNQQITGLQTKMMSLWQIDVSVEYKMSTKASTYRWVAAAVSPKAAEEFFGDWAAVHIEGRFEIKKISPVKCDYMYLPGESTKNNLNTDLYYYKCATNNVEGNSTIYIVQSISAESAIGILKDKKQIDYTYRLVDLKELDIEEIFTEGLLPFYY